LVIGFLLVTLGTASATSTILLGLVAILICYLWLDTRIQISDWRNALVCHSCGQTCKYY
jgi:hypothetical protein